uniref:protein SAR DEFICIENT 1-like n=1 Tax=Erigeron canadensis TaxID=72917 RepID=UPI001CB8FFDD|nr:protein SAR DEFICIENT 1-like [Erigeron canadensis]
MAHKRPFGDVEREGLNNQSKRRIITASSIFAQNVMPGLSSHELAITLEPFLRNLVRDEVHRSCQRFFSTRPISINAPETIKKTSLQLRFLARLPNTFFTGSQIESADNTSVKLVLFDVDSNKVISSGPFSSMKVEIVALDGDFCVGDEEDWGKKDFEDKVICARDGRRPLITGDLVLTLENGVADLGELCFTDNSSWRRSRKFMIGARVKETSTGLRIREAISQAFIVKDQRGVAYKKHHPPSLVDEIWRLEKIAKDGVFHERLASHRIYTVKDFLQMYFTNESLLRELLGRSSNKTWEIIIKHAKECILDDKLYIYRCGVDGIGLLFDSVLSVKGATFDGQNYLSIDKLSIYQMPVVEDLKQQVYRNLNKSVPIDVASYFEDSVPMSILNHSFPNNASLGHQGLNIPLLQQDYGMVDSSYRTQVCVSQDPYSVKCFSPALRNSFIIKEFGNGAYDQDLATNFDYQNGTSLWHGNELFIDPSNQTIDIVTSDYGIYFSGSGSPRARWCKIRAALKWGSVRRDVAAKRLAQPHPFLSCSV